MKAILFRILFITLTLLFFSLPILLYFILWLTLPNYKKDNNLKKRYKYQMIGSTAGIILGPLFAILIPSLTTGFLNGIILLILLAFSFIGGGVIGFFTGRYFYERELNK